MRSISIGSLALSVIFSATSAQAIDPVSFHTPSKNIYCYGYVEGSETTVDCELLTKTNGQPLRPAPADCEQDWGNRFAVNDTGKAYMVCAGDTLRGSDSMLLPYDKPFNYYGVFCTATEQGLECINDDVHGFKISKGKQEMY